VTVKQVVLQSVEQVVGPTAMSQDCLAAASWEVTSSRVKPQESRLELLDELVVLVRGPERTVESRRRAMAPAVTDVVEL
jgi:hypothetical protein